MQNSLLITMSTSSLVWNRPRKMSGKNVIWKIFG
jgi:hypothetical protein